MSKKLEDTRKTFNAMQASLAKLARALDDKHESTESEVVDEILDLFGSKDTHGTNK